MREDSELPHEPWTITHGFYVSMGGFVIDLDTPSVRSAPQFLSNTTRLTFTPRVIVLLTKYDCLPSITRDDILDKSKTHGPGKFLACVQTFWMPVQVRTPLALGLRIILLEVAALGHVLCCSEQS